MRAPWDATKSGYKKWSTSVRSIKFVLVFSGTKLFMETEEEFSSAYREFYNLPQEERSLGKYT